MRKKKAVRVWPKSFSANLDIFCRACDERLEYEIHGNKFSTLIITPCKCSKLIIDQTAKSVLGRVEAEIGFKVFSIINEAWKEFQRRLDLIKK
jgi:hypothetical protein